ncbi:MAG: lipoprotein NlpI [Methanoregulaceae archaeon PtaB.Bin056]|jgi:tetratricopeptide (TPR) repeat protein|nr:MAG: lipoprotein NlpI [Methanoregulaceae archaeon PtaB.Bin056]
MARTISAVLLVITMACLLCFSHAVAEDANTVYQQALDLYYQQKLDDALVTCERALLLNPKSSSSWVLKGLILDDLGRYQEALNAYDEAITLKPNSHIAYNNKGNTLKHMVRYDEALEAYDQSLKINPSYTTAYYNKGNLLSLIGRYNDAIKSLDSALSYDPHYADAWYAKGLVYQKMTKHQDAIFCFEKAIAEKTEYKEAYYKKGVSLIELGWTDDAIMAFSKALDIDPQYTDAKIQLNKLLQENATQGEIPGAPVLPTGVDMWLLLIIILIAGGAGAGILFFRSRHALPWNKPELRATGISTARSADDAACDKEPRTPWVHDVFISYSSQDKAIADAVCAGLEARRIRCWIAPRDLMPGVLYQEGIIRAIEGSRFMVFIFSSHSNNSPHIIRELTKAVSSGVIIIPFRIEDVLPSKTMEYLIGAPHWLDALTPPLEAHILKLADTIESLLSSERDRNTEQEKRI